MQIDFFSILVNLDFATLQHLFSAAAIICNQRPKNISPHVGNVSPTDKYESFGKQCFQPKTTH